MRAKMSAEAFKALLMALRDGGEEAEDDDPAIRNSRARWNARWPASPRVTSAKLRICARRRTSRRLRGQADTAMDSARAKSFEQRWPDVAGVKTMARRIRDGFVFIWARTCQCREFVSP